VNETERIHKMVEAGTITGDEAERLLSVLREIDGAEEQLNASGEAMEDEAQRIVDRAAAPNDAGNASAAIASEPAAKGAAPSAAPAAAATGAAASAAAASAAAPEGTRWVHVALLAGDIALRADPQATEVVLAGDVEGVKVEPTDDGFSIRHQMADHNDSWVDRILTRIRTNHLDVRVPAGYGVDLSITAGDVDLDGIPYLRGHLTSGDLDARGLRGIDFRTAAGDLDLEMTLTEGRHSLRATAGDVNVKLGAGSDVDVRGAVSIGDASVRAPGFDAERRGLGQRFEGRVGGGAATLDLHVTTGDLEVRVDDER